MHEHENVSLSYLKIYKNTLKTKVYFNEIHGIFVRNT